MQKLFTVLFRLLGAVAPGLAGRRAASLFLAVRRHLVNAAGAAELMAMAHRARLPWRQGELVTYHWPRPGGAQVLVVHGWSDSAANLAVLVRALLDAGHDVTAIDMPAHGESSGNATNMGQWTRALREVSATLGGWDAVIAHSLGACCAALATQAALPLDGVPLATRRLVLLAPPNRVHDAVVEFQRWLRLSPRVVAAMEAELIRRVGADYRGFNTGDALADFAGEALVVHDVHDRRVRIDDFHAVRARAPQHSYMETTGLGHRRLLADDHVIAAIREFLAPPGSRRVAG